MGLEVPEGSTLHLPALKCLTVRGTLPLATCQRIVAPALQSCKVAKVTVHQWTQQEADQLQDACSSGILRYTAGPLVLVMQAVTFAPGVPVPALPAALPPTTQMILTCGICACALRSCCCTLHSHVSHA